MDRLREAISGRDSLREIASARYARLAMTMISGLPSGRLIFESANVDWQPSANSAGSRHIFTTRRSSPANRLPWHP
jgi:hypothetical protein